MMNSKKFQLALLINIMLIIGFICLGGCEADKNKQNQMDSSSTRTEINDDQIGQKILIVTSEYPPYTTRDGMDDGFLTQIVKAVLEEAKMEYQLEFYPWGRCEEMLESGEAWTSFPYSYTVERADYANFSDSLFRTQHKFYFLKSNKKINEVTMTFSQISDFNDYTFGGANGYWYGDPDAIKSLGIKTEWANNTDALIKMLYAGRIEFMIEDELVGDEAIARLFPEDVDAFGKLPNNARTQDYYLLISKAYPNSDEYRNKFNEALERLEENGEIERILKQNGIHPNQK